MEHLLEQIEQIRNEKARDNSLIPRMVLVYDIFGGVIYLDIKAISSMYESTPEQREIESKHTERLNKERGFE
jgi:hypothetical protein